jgi:hypothetical protein
MHSVLSRRDDYAPRLRATFKGFEILSRDKPGAPVPDLFIRGAGTYTAHINADNPLGTMQSIEHTLRALDKAAEDERHQVGRLEKTLADYQTQANRPFEHEMRLKELLMRQAQLNATLDLDKNDAQAAEPAETTEPDRSPLQHRMTPPRPGGDSPQALSEIKVSRIKTLNP